MKTKAIFLLLISAFACFMGCAGRTASTAYREFKPQTAVIYTDGTAILEEKIEKSGLAAGGILLPPQLDLDTVSVSQNGERLKNFMVEEKRVPVPSREDPRKTELISRYLITFPGYDGKGPLTLRYSVSGIDWTPRIEAGLKEGGRAALYLGAVITAEDKNLIGCSLTLMNSGAKRTSGAKEDIFEIGKVDLRAGSTVFNLLKEEEVSYSTYYSWNASEDVGAELMMAFKSPFGSSMHEVPFLVTSNGVVVRQGALYEMLPGEEVELASGVDPAVKVYRAVTTREDVMNKILPFNHAITLRVQNLTGGPIKLKIFFEKKLGYTHRNLYHFPIPPNEMPGEWLLWNLELPAGGAKEIPFNFDSEVKDFDEYLHYDLYAGGR